MVFVEGCCGVSASVVVTEFDLEYPIVQFFHHRPYLSEHQPVLRQIGRQRHNIKNFYLPVHNSDFIFRQGYSWKIDAAGGSTSILLDAMVFRIVLVDPLDNGPCQALCLFRYAECYSFAGPSGTIGYAQNLP